LIPRVKPPGSDTQCQYPGRGRRRGKPTSF